MGDRFCNSSANVLQSGSRPYGYWAKRWSAFDASEEEIIIIPIGFARIFIKMKGDPMEGIAPVEGRSVSIRPRVSGSVSRRS
jgi:hypothetical protein